MLLGTRKKFGSKGENWGLSRNVRGRTVTLERTQRPVTAIVCTVALPVRDFSLVRPENSPGPWSVYGYLCWTDSSEGEARRGGRRGETRLGEPVRAGTRRREGRCVRESLDWITGRLRAAGGWVGVGGKEEAVGAFDLGRGRRQSVHPLSYNGVLSGERERDNATNQSTRERQWMKRASRGEPAVVRSEKEEKRKELEQQPPGRTDGRMVRRGPASERRGKGEKHRERRTHRRRTAVSLIVNPTKIATRRERKRGNTKRRDEAIEGKRKRGQAKSERKREG